MRVISCRPPLWGRIACALCFAGFGGAIVAVNASDHASGKVTAWVFLPLILMVLTLMTFASRLIMLSFRADAGGVAVHNVFSTRHFAVTEITGFDIGARFLLASSAVRVMTRSGTFPIDAYERRPDLLLDYLCDIADELGDWLADARRNEADFG